MTAQQAGKADMRVVLFLNGVQSIRIRVRQIQVVAQHRNCLLYTSGKRAYLHRMQHTEICVASTGLHGSTGWKLAE